MSTKILPVYVALQSGLFFESLDNMDVVEMEKMIHTNRAELNKFGATKKRSKRDTNAVWEATEALEKIEMPTVEHEGVLEVVWPAEEFYFLYVTQKGAVEPSQHDGQGTISKLGVQIPTVETWSNGTPRAVKIGFDSGADSKPKIALRIQGGSKTIRLEA